MPYPQDGETCLYDEYEKAYSCYERVLTNALSLKRAIVEAEIELEHANDANIKARALSRKASDTSREIRQRALSNRAVKAAHKEYEELNKRRPQANSRYETADARWHKASDAFEAATSEEGGVENPSGQQHLPAKDDKAKKLADAQIELEAASSELAALNARFSEVGATIDSLVGQLPEVKVADQKLLEADRSLEASALNQKKAANVLDILKTGNAYSEYKYSIEQLEEIDDRSLCYLISCVYQLAAFILAIRIKQMVDKHTALKKRLSSTFFKLPSSKRESEQEDLTEVQIASTNNIQECVSNALRTLDNLSGILQADFTDKSVVKCIRYWRMLKSTCTLQIDEISSIRGRIDQMNGSLNFKRNLRRTALAIFVSCSSLFVTCEAKVEGLFNSWNTPTVAASHPTTPASNKDSTAQIDHTKDQTKPTIPKPISPAPPVPKPPPIDPSSPKPPQ